MNFLKKNVTGLALSLILSSAMAQPAQLPAADLAEIQATIKVYYALSHEDAECTFGPVGDNGIPTDPHMRDRDYRAKRYEQTIKPLFSSSLLVKLKKYCVDRFPPGITDFRLMTDSEIDTDPAHIGNLVSLRLRRIPRLTQATPARATVRVDWEERVKGGKDPLSVGRTDIVFIKESTGWRIDDMHSTADNSGPPSKFDAFFSNPDDTSGVRLRELPGL